MRVLAMAHRWIPRHNAGAEVMLQAMLAALVDRGHTVDVVLSGHRADRYDLDGVAVWPGLDPMPLLKQATVIVTHLETTPAASKLGQWNGVPVVQVLHNTMQITRDGVRAGEPALVVANSNWMLADYQAHLGDAMPPAIVCRPPVRAADYATTSGDRITLVNLRRMELSAGGGRMGKGAELFWQLARALPEQNFLGVVGGYGVQDIRWLPNVEVIDHVPHALMRDRVYARTRVLLMPSSYESWGRVAVEAMASGIPVIAHPTPGLMEACAYAGLYFDRADVEGWAAALRALDDPDYYAERSALARQRVLELDPADDLKNWCGAVQALFA